MSDTESRPRKTTVCHFSRHAPGLVVALKQVAQGYVHDEGELVVPLPAAGLRRLPPWTAFYDKYHLPQLIKGSDFENALGSGWQDLWSQSRSLGIQESAFRQYMLGAIKAVQAEEWPSQAELDESTSKTVSQLRKSTFMARLKAKPAKFEKVYLRRKPSDGIGPATRILKEYERSGGLLVSVYFWKEKDKARTPKLGLNAVNALLGVTLRFGMYNVAFDDSQAELYNSLLRAAERASSKKIEGTLKLEFVEVDRVMMTLETDHGILDLRRIADVNKDNAQNVLRTLKWLVEQEGSQGEWWAVEEEEGWTLKRGTEETLAAYPQKLSATQ